MAVPLDLKDRAFGRLTAREPTRRAGRWAWRCDCECGGSAVVTTAHLTRGLIRSCGCLSSEAGARAAARNTSHAAAKTCPGCGAPFLGTAKQRYCGESCRRASALVGREDRPCHWCGATVRGARRDQIYCDDTCRIKAQGRRLRLRDGRSLDGQIEAIARKLGEK